MRAREPKKPGLTRRLMSFAIVCTALSAYAIGADNLSIGRMQVSIWPEYDDPSVLAIYDGRFEDVTSFPIKTTFLLPKGSIINDACSLSHEGQHFCQLYSVRQTTEFDEIELYLPYPNFYLSFHFTPFDVSVEKRSFRYRIKANHLIDKLEIDIQQPLRSTEFNISPGDGQLNVEGEETHYHYTYDEFDTGREQVFDIGYAKKDQKPSMDIKYSRMSGPKVFSSPYETQRNIRTILYLIFGTGIGGVMVITFWLLKSRKKAAAG